MERNFARSLSLVLKHEGGYVNHPSDPGGATNKGITIGTYRRYINRNGTVSDLRNITDAQVATVYKRHYWDAVKGDNLPDGIDYATFDFAVNSGPSRAAKYLQSVLGVSQDGIVGPVTIGAARSVDASRAINRLCDDRLAFMQRITSGGRRLWDTFGRGWTNRVADVRKHALDMAASAPTQPQQPKPAPTQPKAPETPSQGNVGSLVALAIIAGLAALGAWLADLPCNLIGIFCGG